MATNGLRPYYYAFIIFASSNGGGWGGVGGVVGRYVNNGLLFRSSSSAFVVSAATITNPSSSSATMSSLSSSDNTDNTNECSTLLPSKVSHQQDSNLWLYRVQSTTSTMDEARKIVDEITTASKNNDESGASSYAKPKSFVISAASQTQGRGTTQRKWKSSQRGNALFTIGIPQASWMTDLKMKNNGRMVPLTLLPLQVGSLVAQNIQRSLEECIHSDNQQNNGDNVEPPKVTVKWPNDVLLKQSTNTTNNTASYEKVAGILIESAKDWFLIGIGINVGYAPDIPTDGVDYGRKATCFSRYCNSVDAAAMDENSNEEYWVEVSQKLGNDIAYDLHSWLHHTQVDDASIDEHYSGEAILDKWKSYLDWDMELILRDTPKRERVTLTDVMEDGRVIVKEVETGMTRTLVADYFL
jgi:BirA family biotin operon repressor/biotin-[acetyl-CoA-carboxylase] ligase